MTAAARHMHASGYDRARLTVLESNLRARDFYAKMGGMEVDRREVEFVGSRLGAIELEWIDLERLGYCWATTE